MEQLTSALGGHRTGGAPTSPWDSLVDARLAALIEPHLSELREQVEELKRSQTDARLVYTINEAADRLKVSRRTITRLKEAGRINYFLVGQSVRFTEAHILGFIAANQTYSKQRQPSTMVN